MKSKKLTKKTAEQLIHDLIPKIKVESDSGYDCIGAYIAQTPGMTITCRFDHIMPWKHIQVTVETGAVHNILMLYSPDTLERDYKAEADWERAE